MKKVIFLLIIVVFSPVFSKDNPLVVKESRYDPEKATTVIINSLKNYGFQLFNVIDHHLNMASSGIDIEFERVILFGNPVVESRLMKENPLIGLELPLRILVFKKGDKTYVAYKNPLFTEKVYGMKKMHNVFARMNGILQQITDKVIREK